MHAHEPTPGRQPFLHDAVVALRAPAQAWSAPDGSMGSRAIDGVYVSDVRIARELRVLVGGRPGEHIATLPDGAARIRFVSLHRDLDDASGADPDVRGTLTRTVTATGVEHRFELASRLDASLDTTLTVELALDLGDMQAVKAGLATDATGAGDAGAPAVVLTGSGATWSNDVVEVSLEAPGAALDLQPDGVIRMSWPLAPAPRASASAGFTLSATDSAAVVAAPGGPAPWSAPEPAGADDRLQRWLRRALDDLDGLRLETARAPGHQFLAAGAPWFFTLFGRDSLWAARLLLPLGTGIAGGTLRVLAALQGRHNDPETAEQPGKIMHELRRGALSLPGERVELPPLYYGTVDATPLWVCLLHDAWRAGLPDDEVRQLLPHAVAALEWMRDFGDSDGDGLLEYVDASGRGLSNQGWKDSGDSVQWSDGRLAEGPIALCEVQAYAYEAAMHGADLLDAFGGEGEPWRGWAGRLAARFRESFWVPHPDGAYPAIALDAHKRPVDTLTSNIGHLLGTGLLDAGEAALVARRLVSPGLDSGFGLRTMSTESAGYWPLSYHGGSVWTHDTAIAIAGLAADGFAAEAATLAEGLLRAAVAFDYRMPELYSGDPASDSPAPVPYPAACRPQAWSAAAAVAVLAATARS